MAKISEMKDLIEFWSEEKRFLKDPDPELRINITLYIWKDDMSKWVIVINRFKFSNIEELYEKIIKRCKFENESENIVSTFIA